VVVISSFHVDMNAIYAKERPNVIVILLRG
jgi:hypothetical protein